MIELGVAIAFTAAVANAVAITLQAVEARDSPAQESGRFRLLWRLAHRPRWAVGTALMALAWPLQVLALAFAPLTVVQPVLASFELILLALARFKLGERIGRVEVSGAVAITVGVVLVIVAAPHRSVPRLDAVRVAIPFALIGTAALAAYSGGRLRASPGLLLTLGAGFGYAWVDFADKLLSNAISVGHALPAVIWMLAVMAFGALALLQENSALQCRSPVLVAPVIGAIQEPLPVLMALAAGVEAWGVSVPKIASLASGLALAGLGAAILAHSPSVARVAAGSTSQDASEMAVGGGVSLPQT